MGLGVRAQSTSFLDDSGKEKRQSLRQGNCVSKAKGEVAKERILEEHVVAV